MTRPHVWAFTYSVGSDFPEQDEIAGGRRVVEFKLAQAIPATATHHVETHQEPTLLGRSTVHTHTWTIDPDQPQTIPMGELVLTTWPGVNMPLAVTNPEVSVHDAEGHGDSITATLADFIELGRVAAAIRNAGWASDPTPKEKP